MVSDQSFIFKLLGYWPICRESLQYINGDRNYNNTCICRFPKARKQRRNNQESKKPAASYSTTFETANIIITPSLEPANRSPMSINNRFRKKIFLPTVNRPKTKKPHKNRKANSNQANLARSRLQC